MCSSDLKNRIVEVMRTENNEKGLETDPGGPESSQQGPPPGPHKGFVIGQREFHGESMRPMNADVSDSTLVEYFRPQL